MNRDPIDHFIEQMGFMTQEDGLPRIAGQVLGYLLVEGEPRTLAEITEALSISKASASTNCRQLADKGILTRVATRGSRADSYMAVTNPAEDMLAGMAARFRTRARSIEDAAASGFVKAVKWYPAGATTNSDAGVTAPEKLGPVFAAMQEHGLPLLIHGEVTDHHIDIFDREAEFIDRYMRSLVSDYPELKVVFEHITTADAAEFVAQASDNVAATITAHHLLYNRNDMLVGGIRPHYFCLPILKRNRHQQALIEAATSGSPKFFLGTDSAPHPVGKKETDCGCAGCYTAHAAIELYAEAFDNAGALDKLEAFASFYGPDFYGLPRNSDRIPLSKTPWQAPEQLPLGEDSLRPLRAGDTLQWQVVPHE